MEPSLPSAAAATAATFQISDWVQAAYTLFLGAVSLFIPYLGEMVKRKLFAPKL